MPYQLPAQGHGKSGISYGSFDFAVDGDGQWWFLEVNEGGQFLWLDAFNCNLHVQEKFLAFLTSPEGSSRQSTEEFQRPIVMFAAIETCRGNPAGDKAKGRNSDPVQFNEFSQPDCQL